MLASSPPRNQNAHSRVTLPDTFCKETASCLTNIAHPSVTRPSPNPATPVSSSAVLSPQSRCCCGLCSAKARPRLLTTAARPTPSRWKRLRQLRLIQWLQHLLTLSHQPRLTPSPRPLPIRSPLRLLILSRLRPLTRHLPHLRQHLPTRNTAGLRAGFDLTNLGGHRAVSALFSFAQTPAPKLPTGMTLC